MLSNATYLKVLSLFLVVFVLIGFPKQSHSDLAVQYIVTNGVLEAWYYNPSNMHLYHIKDVPAWSKPMTDYQAIKPTVAARCGVVAAKVLIVVGTAVAITLVADRQMNGNWLWEEPNIGYGISSLFGLGTNLATNSNPNFTTVSCTTIANGGDLSRTHAACKNHFSSMIVEDGYINDTTCGELWSSPSEPLFHTCMEFVSSCVERTRSVCQAPLPTEVTYVIEVNWNNGETTRSSKTVSTATQVDPIALVNSMSFPEPPSGLTCSYEDNTEEYWEETAKEGYYYDVYYLDNNYDL